jgi:hypothetical protein
MEEEGAEATADKETRKKPKRAQEAKEALALQVSVTRVAEESPSRAHAVVEVDVRRLFASTQALRGLDIHTGNNVYPASCN